MKLKGSLQQIIFFVILSFLFNQKTFSQCPQIESILVDACDTGSDEGLNEMVRFKVGATAINTSSLSVNWPNNSWQLLAPNATTKSKVDDLNLQITAAGGCGQLIQPTSGVLPANAKVILVTSFNFDIALNYFGAITEDIYIIFQNNPSTTIGHFANYGTTGTIARTLLMSFGVGCSDSVTYQKTSLINTAGNSYAENGATVNFTPLGTATYVNNGCVAPVDVFSVDAGNSPISACAGATVSLLGIAQGQQTVGWTALSGSFSSPTTLATNYTIDPTAIGAITLTLKATNSCSVVKTDDVIVNINLGTAPIINCGTTTSSSVQFTWAAVAGATGYSVSYQIGTGTPTSFVAIGNLLNYTVYSLAAGENVTITVLPTGGSGTCFVSSSKMCTSNGCVPPVLTITNPAAVCFTATVDITLASVTVGSTGSGTLTYWTNLAATSGLASPTAIATGGTYYIKSTLGTCTVIKPVLVSINPTPVLTITNPPAVCSPATVDITLASVTVGSTGSGTLTYWTNLAATSGLASPTAIATGGTYYIKSTLGTCTDIKPVLVSINSTPVLTITNPSAVCSPATVDITSASVTAGSTGSGTLTYWTNATATTALANPLAVATTGTYYIKSTLGTCTDIKPVTVIVNPAPVLTIMNPPAVCSPGTVDITSASVTAGSTGSGTLTYWTNAAATIALTNQATISTSGTYYIKSTNGSCSGIKPIVVSINSTPVLTITNPSAVCSPATVDITLALVTAGSTGSGILSYWTNAAATIALTNQATISTSGTYYIKSTNGSCSDIKPVVVSINSTPVLTITNPSAVCSPATVDITLASVTVGSTGSGILTYWTNLAATSGLASPMAIAVSGTYYIKSTLGTCSDIKPVVVTVSDNQPINSVYYLCIDKAGLLIAPVTIDSNLSPSQYSFAWTFNGDPISTTTSSYPASTLGTYQVIATDLSGGCVKILIADVKESNEATATATVGTDFDNQQEIIVTVTGGLGNYSYQLNDGLIQKSNIFSVSQGGEYNVNVIDNLGCNNFILDVTVLNYPRFFTPNGDGFHDTWNISGLPKPDKSVIFIFDRYGKLLKEIAPLGEGWDGIYNSHVLPSTDYWFKILYQDAIGVNKEFKAHFSLKR